MRNVAAPVLHQEARWPLHMYQCGDNFNTNFNSLTNAGDGSVGAMLRGHVVVCKEKGSRLHRSIQSLCTDNGSHVRSSSPTRTTPSWEVLSCIYIRSLNVLVTMILLIQYYSLPIFFLLLCNVQFIGIYYCYCWTLHAAVG